ncbi:hypothetical protein WJX82_010931 [Trebouxia sp. C0006]
MQASKTQGMGETQLRDSTSGASFLRCHQSSNTALHNTFKIPDQPQPCKNCVTNGTEGKRSRLSRAEQHLSGL